MYILYKEPGQFLGTVVPIYTCDGRQICQVNDDTFNYHFGKVVNYLSLPHCRILH